MLIALHFRSAEVHTLFFVFLEGSFRKDSGLMYFIKFDFINQAPFLIFSLRDRSLSDQTKIFIKLGFKREEKYQQLARVLMKTTAGCLNCLLTPKHYWS